MSRKKEKNGNPLKKKQNNLCKTRWSKKRYWFHQSQTKEKIYRKANTKKTIVREKYGARLNTAPGEIAQFAKCRKRTCHTSIWEENKTVITQWRQFASVCRSESKIKVFTEERLRKSNETENKRGFRGNEKLEKANKKREDKTKHTTMAVTVDGKTTKKTSHSECLLHRVHRILTLKF